MFPPAYTITLPKAGTLASAHDVFVALVPQILSLGVQGCDCWFFRHSDKGMKKRLPPSCLSLRGVFALTRVQICLAFPVNSASLMSVLLLALRAIVPFCTGVLWNLYLLRILHSKDFTKLLLDKLGEKYLVLQINACKRS